LRAGVSSAAPGVRSLEPVDEARLDPSLAALISDLRAAVERRDVRGLMAQIGPAFRVDFDRGKGPAAFRSRWRLNAPDSDLWQVMGRLLSIGGTFYSPTLYAVPYVYTRFPVDLDPFGHVVVLQPHTPLRSVPESSGGGFKTVGTEILRLAQPLKPPARLDRMAWVNVVTAEGVTGYLPGAAVYSPAGYRAFFERQRGRWRWISLVCAD
jgi:hypothetical protein